MLYLGTVVTGSGPHAGDVDVPRNGLDPLQLSQPHADAVFLFVGLPSGWSPCVHSEHRRDRAGRCVLVVVELAQGLIGFVQYFTDLPVVLVELPPARRRPARRHADLGPARGAGGVAQSGPRRLHHDVRGRRSWRCSTRSRRSAYAHRWTAAGALTHCWAEQTREHDDLDLVIVDLALPKVVDLLETEGFEVERDLLPTALALRHRDGRGRRPASGARHARRRRRPAAPRHAGVFHYDAPETGTIDGQQVPCCSVNTQVATHLGYPPADEDVADMLALADALRAHPPRAVRRPWLSSATSSVRSVVECGPSKQRDKEARMPRTARSRARSVS